jgi:hypothetical protein
MRGCTAHRCAYICARGVGFSQLGINDNPRVSIDSRFVKFVILNLDEMRKEKEGKEGSWGKNICTGWYLAQYKCAPLFVPNGLYRLDTRYKRGLTTGTNERFSGSGSSMLRPSVYI